jgi:hypothetical protein
MAKNERQLHITAPADQIDYITAHPRAHTNQQYLLLALDALLQPDSPACSLHPGLWDVGEADWRGVHVTALHELESASLRTYDPDTMYVVAEHAGLWLKESFFGPSKRHNDYTPHAWVYDANVGPAALEGNLRLRALNPREHAQAYRYQKWAVGQLGQRRDWNAHGESIPSYKRAEAALETLPGLDHELTMAEVFRIGGRYDSDGHKLPGTGLTPKQAHDEAPKRRKLLGKPSNRPMARFTTSLPKEVREPLLQQVQRHAGDPTLARFAAYLWMWAHSSQPNHEVPMNVACKLRAFAAQEHWMDVRERYLTGHPSPSRFHLIDPRDPILGPIPQQTTLTAYIASTK